MMMTDDDDDDDDGRRISFCFYLFFSIFTRNEM